jgi:hypothetical protein
MTSHEPTYTDIGREPAHDVNGSAPGVSEPNREGRYSAPTFGEIAEKLLDNGYAPLPIRPGSKAPAPSRWTSVEIDAQRVEAWARYYPDHGVGLRTGHLVGIDIDILDADLAWQVKALAERRLGETLLRVGRWPKQLLLYRTETPFSKIDLKPLEVLGKGQQFVAFGLHETTRKSYYWPLGDTPLNVPLDQLPQLDHDAIQAFVAEAKALVPEMGESAGSIRRRSGDGGGRKAPTRDETDRVVDGRDNWLSMIAFHAVHDAIDRGYALDPHALADLVWTDFTSSTDLQRPRQDGTRVYTPEDALRKVRDKLRLHREGRLPQRQRCDIEASYTAPQMTVDQARARLDETLQHACDRILAWHGGEWEAALPCIGIRATVGLGKSSASRKHLSALQAKLREMDAPHRILVFTPSHALAEETALAWVELGSRPAVLRGYERAHPLDGAPMCRDHEVVKAAIAAGLDPQSTVCVSTDGSRCPFFEGCLKQMNRNDVRAADIVIAPYDALFTGFAVDPDTIGVLVIDEGCWARAVRRTTGLIVEGLTTELTGDLGTGIYRNRAAGQIADRLALRQKLQAALDANGTGNVAKQALQQAGLTEEDCAAAIRLERQLLEDPGLAPGLSVQARAQAFRSARANERTLKLVALWEAVRAILAGTQDVDGRLRVGDHDTASGTRPVTVLNAAELHLNFRGKPILHLDATLRPEIAGRLLPGLATESIDAAAPHMQVHLVHGRFGKTAIVPGERASVDENRRRSHNLIDCVDHVRWHARRLAPGRILVVTYKDVEAAFADIPNVETGHFNAIAGLDSFGDVAALFVIGRPLPPDTGLRDPCAALLRHGIEGGYARNWSAVRMRDGSSRAVRVTRHGDEQAELFRAAICDDELVQAIGRGRGVNRTAANPLAVHILADVALPLVHDTVTAWETIQPDVVQRMFLGGVAVSSPADAAMLHPDLLVTAEAARKHFDRIGFNGQIPNSTYRGMSVKSAAYRRPGRGRSWQQVWWIEGSSEEVHGRIESRLGDLAAWKPGS